MSAAVSQMIPRLEARELSVFRDGVRLIAGLNLSIQPGTLVGLVGANGSGKSALLRGLSGILTVRGTLCVDGRDVRIANPLQALNHKIALCPAEGQVFPRLTVTETLLVGGHTLDAKSRQSRSEFLLERFPELAVRKSIAAGQLSGGERQQLAVAYALMTTPRMLLLDEPSRGLSPGALDIVVTVLKEQAQAGMAVLIADQAADWLWPHVDRLLVMADARITADIDPRRQSVDDVSSIYFDLKRD